MKEIRIPFFKILLIILTIYTLKSFFFGTATIKITNGDFETMMINSEIKKITLIANKKIVQIRVKQKNIKSAMKRIFERQEKENEDEKMSNSWLKNLKKMYLNVKKEENDVLFVLEIPSVSVFDKNYNNIKKKMTEESEKIGYETVRSINVFSIISNVLHFLFTLCFILLFFNPDILLGGSKSGLLDPLGKNKIKEFDNSKKEKITLKDIAGMSEVKMEVRVIIDYIKNKRAINYLGGISPRGYLFAGEPGLGKTLMAKAVAGEAGCRFYYACGSDFISPFWGTASRKINALFDLAEKTAPSIIFIDEIDSIGRSRELRYSMNEDGENALNTLLSRMDGFDSSGSDVTVIASTNRPGILDKALLRACRFDKKIYFDLPSLNDRIEVFNLYLKKINIEDNIDVKLLAENTVGFSYAQISSLCNEAALLAAREKAKKVSVSHLYEAIDREILGIEKKSRYVIEKERKMIAYHEAGHAAVGWFLKTCNTLMKVSIISRGPSALGYAKYSNNERFLKTRQEMLDEICVCLGGRVAQELTFGDISTGAENDYSKSFKIARDMITTFGMNKIIGPLSFYNFERGELEKSSDDTQSIIDKEIRILIHKMYDRTKKIIKKYKKKIDIMADLLLKKETLNKDEIEEIFGPREEGNFYDDDNEKKGKKEKIFDSQESDSFSENE